MGSAIAEFGVFAVSLNQLQARHQATLHVVAFHQQGLLFDLTLSLTGSHFSHTFTVSPIHLNQLQARHRATLCVVAFHQQELLFDLTLLLMGSHTFHMLSWSLQSISINFELDVGLHSMYLISPYHSMSLPVFPSFFTHSINCKLHVSQVVPLDHLLQSGPIYLMLVHQFSLIIFLLSLPLLLGSTVHYQK
jgi:hypothetical protein